MERESGYVVGLGGKRPHAAVWCGAWSGAHGKQGRVPGCRRGCEARRAAWLGRGHAHVQAYACAVRRFWFLCVTSLGHLLDPPLWFSLGWYLHPPALPLSPFTSKIIMNVYPAPPLPHPPQPNTQHPPPQKGARPAPVGGGVPLQCVPNPLDPAWGQVLLGAVIWRCFSQGCCWSHVPRNSHNGGVNPLPPPLTPACPACPQTLQAVHGGDDLRSAVNAVLGYSATDMKGEGGRRREGGREGRGGELAVRKSWGEQITVGGRGKGVAGMEGGQRGGDIAEGLGNGFPPTTACSYHGPAFVVPPPGLPPLNRTPPAL